jgi:hypothetical protein
LGKRKATHLPAREDPAKKVKADTKAHQPSAAAAALKLNEAYQLQQEEHLKSVERDRK